MWASPTRLVCKVTWKEETTKSSHRCWSILPSSRLNLSWAWANFWCKNGTPIPNQLLLPTKERLEPKDRRIEAVVPWLLCTYLLGQTIIESNSNKNTGPQEGQSQSHVKRGNPGQVREGQNRNSLPNNVSSTYYITKLRSGYDNRDGGKIAEKAKAKSNVSDMLNSVCLNEVATNRIGNGKKIRDLQRARSISTSTIPTNLKKELVEIEQRKLVQLAAIKGTHDIEVFKLQLIMARSRIFREYAVDIIKSKPGSQTPGIDKEIYDREKTGMYDNLVEYLRDMIYHPNKYKAAPVKRVWIPKPGKEEKRPLGIPTVKDRALQALINLVLNPLVELTSDEDSYGFRPYRDCKMAIAAARAQLKTVNVEKATKSLKKRHRGTDLVGAYTIPNQEKWILDADIKGFFPNINHDWLMTNLFLHPELKKFINQWLKAKIFDEGTYTDPITGTPQGGIISPTLGNFTLNGLEKVIKEAIYPLTKSKEQRMQVKLQDGNRRRIQILVKCIRYADDFIVITRSKNILDKYIKPAINEFLAERGLWLSPEKTKQYQLVNPKAQLDFLGYTFKYRSKWSSKRAMVYTKGGSQGAIALYPNKDRLKAFLARIKKVIYGSLNLTAVELISELNPMIRGWANYYNMENSSHYRSLLRQALYRYTWNWMTKKHPTLGKKTLAEMYFLRPETKVEAEEVTDDSPITPDRTETKGYEKMKKYKWTFHGITRTESRFSKKETRTAFLLNPIQCSPIITAIKYLLPESLKTIHGFDDPVRLEQLIRHKLQLAITTSPKTPTLKKKLFKMQKGHCSNVR